LFYIATFLSFTATHCYVKTRGTAIHARSVLSTLKRSAIIQLQLHVSMLCWYYPYKHRHFFCFTSISVIYCETAIPISVTWFSLVLSIITLLPNPKGIDILN